MAPARSKKHKSSSSAATKSPARTPQRSPIKKSVMITQGQKQALIDNLQLEITERARKLRAQYALQAQSLRTRVELRVNRIPTALRRAKMGELLLKYAESATQAPSAVTAIAKQTERSAVAKKVVVNTSKALVASPGHPRGIKRTSETMIHADKENAPDPHDTPNTKKRAKTAATSRQTTNPSTVLSPKSSNSRTLPQSPIRPLLGSPQKSQLSRPVSPLKPASPSKASAIAATSTLAAMVGEKLRTAKAIGTTKKGVRAAPEPKVPAPRAKRGAAVAATASTAPSLAETRTISGSSTASGTSTGTMVVRKIGRALNVANTTVAATKKAVTAGAAGKKAPGPKADVTGVPGAGRRVLRKRA